MSSLDFLPLITFNHQHRMRSLVVFYGSSFWCLKQTQKLLPHYQNWLYVSEKDLLDSSSCFHLKEKKFRTQLGCEWNAIIYDASNGVNPDALGALSGCVRAGGLFVLCLDPRLKGSRFQQWLLYQIYRDPCVWIQSETGEIKKGDFPRVDENIRSEKEGVYATDEQKDAVAAIKKALTGHRNRPLVLTADRGRGKTVALGLAADSLPVETGRELNILVTAPKPSAVDNLFRQLGEKAKKQVHFIAPDLLSDELPPCDLLLVDEAAAIPVPLLERWAEHYKRIVFSSTVHGYEGAGRGFSLKFTKKLKELTPAYKALHITTPVRWAKGCPLEAFVFNALLLKNDFLPLKSKITLDTLRFFEFDFSADIAENQDLLKQAFAILVSAHYQTSPNDLKNLMDIDKAHLFLATDTAGEKIQVVGAILTVEEGEIDVEFCKTILRGERRLQGHLIAQSLMTHSGRVEAGILKSWRVMRIAVHPEIQQQGVGSYLLQNLKIRAKTEKIDYLSTSYGATASLVYFWRKQALQTCVLGIMRDAASGTYSVQAILSFSAQAKMLTEQIRKSLRFNLPYLLSTQRIELSASLVVQLAKDLNYPELPDLAISQVNDYKNGIIGVDLIGASLNLWLWYRLSNSPFNELGKKTKNSVQLKPSIAFLIEKGLFAKDWPYLISHYGMSLSITGRRQATVKLLEIVKGIK